MKGPDHAASLEPSELIQMVKSIRNIEMALGSGLKEPSSSEIKIWQLPGKVFMLQEIFRKEALLLNKI